MLQTKSTRSAEEAETHRSAAPCSQGTGRPKCFCKLCMTLLDFADSQSSSGSKPLPPTVPGQITFSHFFRFFKKKLILGAAPKIIKNRTSIKSSQNLKNRTYGCPKLDFGTILDDFWHYFSINFPGRLNLVICNKYNAKTYFLPFQAFHFSIKNR